MLDARWRRLKQLFTTAAEIDDTDRAAFLDEQCAGDPELRAQVERLIAKSARAGDFLEQPVTRIPEARPLGLGDIFAGHFAIEKLLGVGGMGEVYRALDKRLDRTVAIKVLARKLTDRPEVYERFKREARAISAD